MRGQYEHSFRKAEPMPTPAPTAPTLLADNFDAGSYVVASLAETPAEPEFNQLQSSNPYAAPALLDQQPPNSLSKEILSPKKLQWINGLMGCTWGSSLLCVATVLAIVTVPQLGDLSLLILLSAFVSWFSMILLAYSSRGLVSAIFTLVISFAPVIGMLAFIAVYFRARKILSDHGYRCGWISMVFDPQAYQHAANQMAVATPAVKKPRSTASLVITYGIIGSLIGLITMLCFTGS